MWFHHVPGAGKGGPLDFSVWATGYQFNPGHTRRVVVTGSWFPRFNRNLNLGEPIASARKVHRADQRVFFGGGKPSAVTLPVLVER